MSTVNTNQPDPNRIANRRQIARLKQDVERRRQDMLAAERGTSNRMDLAALYQEARRDLSTAESGVAAKNRGGGQGPLPNLPDINESRAQFRALGEKAAPITPQVTSAPTPEEVEMRRQVMQREVMRNAGSRPLNQPGQFVAEADALRSFAGDVGADRERVAQNMAVRERVNQAFAPLEGDELRDAQQRQVDAARRRQVADRERVALADEILGRQTDTERIATDTRALEEERRRGEIAQAEAVRAQAEQAAREAGGAGASVTEEELAAQRREVESSQLERAVQEQNFDPAVADVAADVRTATRGNRLFGGGNLESVLSRVEGIEPGSLSDVERRNLMEELLVLRSRMGRRNDFIDHALAIGRMSGLIPNRAEAQANVEQRVSAAEQRIDAIISRLRGG